MVHGVDVRHALASRARPAAPGEAAATPLVRASQLLEQARTHCAPRWGWRETAGRLCELAGWRAGATLSLAASLVLDAQRRGEAVAWIQTRSSSFFPHDLAECGIDLEALVVVRPPRPTDLGLAAEWIARSGAFGLVVLDTTALGAVPMAMQSRLLSLAQKHDLGLVCLTEKQPEQPSLSSLVGLRADTFVRRPPARETRSLLDTPGASPAGEPGELAEPHRFAELRELASFECELSVAKDKRRSRPWCHLEARRGTPGLR